MPRADEAQVMMVAYGTSDALTEARVAEELQNDLLLKRLYDEKLEDADRMEIPRRFDSSALESVDSDPDSPCQAGGHGLPLPHPPGQGAAPYLSGRRSALCLPQRRLVGVHPPGRPLLRRRRLRLQDRPRGLDGGRGEGRGRPARRAGAQLHGREDCHLRRPAVEKAEDGATGGARVPRRTRPAEYSALRLQRGGRSPTSTRGRRCPGGIRGALR